MITVEPASVGMHIGTSKIEDLTTRIGVDKGCAQCIISPDGPFIGDCTPYIVDASKTDTCSEYDFSCGLYDDGAIGRVADTWLIDIIGDAYITDDTY